jgi:hypothetical protein
MVKKLAGVVVLALCLSTPIQAATNPVVIATPPQPTWGRPQPGTADDTRTARARVECHGKLSAEEVAGHCATLQIHAPAEQQRLQEKMQDWARLTPHQRLEAREKYKEFSQMAPEEKEVVKQKWQDYKQLPEDEKTAAPGAARQLCACQTTIPDHQG